MRIGHEWCGTIAAVGDGVDPSWVGRRTTGDTMLGCGHCRRCRSGLQHVCRDRYEIGIRGGFPGALAEQLALPVSALHPLPDSVDAIAGALVEPGGNALRAVRGARLTSGDRVLVIGPGTIGLLVAELARAAGAEVHLLGVTERSLAFARTLGFPGVWSADDLPALPWDAVIDASTSPDAPALAVDLVEPGKRVVLRRPGGHTQPDRHPDGGAEGRHRGRNPQRVNGSGRHHRAVRLRRGRPPAARRRHRRPASARVPCSAGGARPAPATVPRSTSIRG